MDDKILSLFLYSDFEDFGEILSGYVCEDNCKWVWILGERFFIKIFY